MKRTVSLIISLCLIFYGVMPAFSDEYKYPQITVTLASDSDEMAFRAWAAALTKAYLNDYLYMVSPANYGTSEVDVTTVRDEYEAGDRIDVHYYTWDKAQWNKTLNYPYYVVAEKKTKFDKTNANSVTWLRGFKVNDIEYSLANLYNADGTGIDIGNRVYMSLLTKIIKNKVMTDPALLSRTSYTKTANKGYYTFDVGSGMMIYDKNLATIDYASRTKTADSAVDAVTGALKVAVATWVAKQDLLVSAKRTAASTAGVADWEVLWDNVNNKLTETILLALVEGADTFADEINQRYLDELYNEMQDSIAYDAASAVITGNRNVLGYLESQYRSSAVHTTRVPTFESSVNELLDLYESDEMYNRLGEEISGSLQEVIKNPDGSIQERVNKVKEHMIGLDMPGKMRIVKSDELIYRSVAAGVITTVADGLIDMIKQVIQDAWEEATNGVKLQNTVAQGIFEELEELIFTDILNDVSDRITATSDELVDLLEERGLNPLCINHGELVRETFKKHFNGGDDKKSFSDALTDMVINRGINIAFKMYGLKAAKDYNGNLKLSSEHQTVEGLISDMEVVKSGVGAALNDCLQMIMPTITDMVFDIIGKRVEVSSGLTSMEKKEFKDEILTPIKNAVNDIAGSDEVWTTEASNQVAIAIVQFVDWYTKVDAAHPESNLFDLLFQNTEGLNFTSGFTADITETVIQSFIKDMPTKIFNTILGYDYEKTKQANLSVSLNAEKYFHSNSAIVCARQAANTYKKMSESGWQELFDIAAIISKVWDSMIQEAGYLITFETSAGNTIAEEDGANLTALLCKMSQDESSEYQAELERRLTSSRQQKYDQGILTKSGERLTGSDAIDRIDSGSEDTSVFSIKCDMLPNEILNPVLTPNLRNIKNNTDSILLQMHIDAAGMGCCNTLTINKDFYFDIAGNSVNPRDNLYKGYLAYGGLTTDDETMRRYNEIVKLIDRFEGSYDSAWNTITQ